MKKFKLSKFIEKLKLFIIAHKIWSAVILIVLIFIGYKIFAGKASAETRYVTTQVAKSTVVASISGSGQVSVSNQIDLKPRVSGATTFIGVKPGDFVKRGKLLFSIDARDAEKAVRDAQTNLDSAKLALAKLQEPPDQLSLIQDQNAIDQANADKKNQDLIIKNSYRNLLNSTPEAVPKDQVTDYTAPTISGNYVLDQEGVIEVDTYATGGGSTFSISGLTTGTGSMSTTTPQPIGNSGLYIKFPTTTGGVNNWLVNLPNKKASNYVSNYDSYQNTLQSSQNAIDSDDRTIAENTEKLKQLQAGTDPIDLETKKLAVTSAENALTDAKQTLSDYYIIAPFDGVIASVGAELGQEASSGTALGTIITKEQLATVSLNEVDVAKINLGDKVTLTFDAIPDLSIAGEIVSIDSIGTVSSGVVNYNIKISFATQDDRVKPGMSVNAAIVTGVSQDVLTVPNSAVKTRNGSSYVQVFDTALSPAPQGTTGSTSKVLPRDVMVEVGLSSDTLTEIKSGLNDGDIVVSRLISSTSTTSQTSSTAPGLFGNGGRGGIGGGAIRNATGR